ncbi:hypothetical protein [Janthinobacterium sp. 13]|uniref:hypothetical protein n=1 Tax=Janthinobacterium sp. 13 TaxID=2035211 RepID=UPI00117B147A|nr:hypothetical protein [Janthinobacterium sp. 13]
MNLTVGTLILGTRPFNVRRAVISRREHLWEIEVETESEEFDGERWEPRLYHQGLLASAFENVGLEGKRTSWIATNDKGYPHPEGGYMCVLGHHDVRSCIVTFGNQSGGHLELKWSGKCDVFWNDEFSEDIPFDCTCMAIVND